MARYEEVFLDSQWEGGGEGTLFDFELIYYPLTTDTGTPEGLKRPEPDSVLGVDIANHGDEKEVYRWNFVIQNNRDRDDYSDLVRFCKSWSLSGTALDAAIQETTDADEWMRMYAMMSLCGIGDAYTFGNNHNVKLWVRPEDRRVLGFPWDWDFAFFLSATGPLWGDQNLAKVVQRPACLHLFYGHLLDILDTVYNTAYMSRWTSHYATLAGENYGTFLSYIGTRASSVRSRLPARVDFEITTNGGEPFSVAASSADIEGNAWVDVATILVEGREERTPISWTTATRWRAAVRLDPGRNSLVFLGFHRDGRFLAFDEIEVTSTVSPPDPAVVSIDPVEGPPGTLVAIAGATSLRAWVPSMEPGVVALVVRNAAGGVVRAGRVHRPRRRSALRTRRREHGRSGHDLGRGADPVPPLRRPARTLRGRRRCERSRAGPLRPRLSPSLAKTRAARSGAASACRGPASAAHGQPAFGTQPSKSLIVAKQPAPWTGGAPPRKR
ncbi:MAG: CotH kinase family protein [Planctomycetota bacterium]